MADNYLERKMEELRSGRLSAPSACPATTALPADALVLRYPKLRVLIADDGLTPLGRAMVNAFIGVGCRVAFFATEADEARQFQQQTGARCYRLRDLSVATDVKAAIADLLRNWHDVDVVVGSAKSPVMQHFLFAWTMHRMRLPLTVGGTLVEWEVPRQREALVVPHGVKRVEFSIPLAPEEESLEAAARMALFHSHPSNHYATETRICIS